MYDFVHIRRILLNNMEHVDGKITEHADCGPYFYELWKACRL